MSTDAPKMQTPSPALAKAKGADATNQAAPTPWAISSASPSAIPVVKWTALRYVGSKKPQPESIDDGHTWVLPFIPHNRQEIEIPPKSSVELDTGIKLSVPEGYEVHVHHTLRRGQSHVQRPCLVIEACSEDRATEVRVPIVNLSAETMRFSPGQPLAHFTLVPLRKFAVEK